MAGTMKKNTIISSREERTFSSRNPKPFVSMPVLAAAFFFAAGLAWHFNHTIVCGLLCAIGGILYGRAGKK
jgi:hypothetical protein